MHLTEAVLAIFTSIVVSVSIPFAIVAARNGNRFGIQIRKHQSLRRYVRLAPTHLQNKSGTEVAYNADVQCTIVLPCVRTGECPDEPLARLVFAQACIQEVGARACAPLSHKWRSADDNRRLARSGVHWGKHKIRKTMDDVCLQVHMCKSPDISGSVLFHLFPKRRNKSKKIVAEPVAGDN